MFLSNFALMNKIILLSAVLFMLFSCGRKSEDKEAFRVEVMNKITPVKDQGNSSLCWVYAMLATIESECLMKGDSVNLSAAYVARTLCAGRLRDAILRKAGRASPRAAWRPG